MINDIEYAPGMRIIVRGEEWMVKRVETNSLGNQTLLKLPTFGGGPF